MVSMCVLDLFTLCSCMYSLWLQIQYTLDIHSTNYYVYHYAVIYL